MPFKCPPAVGPKRDADSERKQDDRSTDVKNSPVIALINRKSGGQRGQKALKLFEKFENVYPVDLLDFAKKDTSEPDKKLQELIDTHKPDVRIVFGGGDGTVAWGFEILQRIERSEIPAAVLALGTGNEFSGCVGWGNFMKVSKKSLKKFLHNIRTCDVIGTDVWKVTYKDDESAEGSADIVKNLPRRPGHMAAFLSWGHDADISHKFHLEREANRGKNKNSRRAGLKMKYIKLGIKELYHPGPVLNDRMELTVDDCTTDLSQVPRSRCIAFLNINRMAQQVDYFGTGKSNKRDLLQKQDYQAPKLNDGKLEVVGTKSLHHLTAMRLNASHGYRIGQGKQFKVILKKPTPMLVDGEAWINPAGEILVECEGNKPVVYGPRHNKATRKGILMDVHELNE